MPLALVAVDCSRGGRLNDCCSAVGLEGRLKTTETKSKSANKCGRGNNNWKEIMDVKGDGSLVS